MFETVERWFAVSRYPRAAVRLKYWNDKMVGTKPSITGYHGRDMYDYYFVVNKNYCDEQAIEFTDPVENRETTSPAVIVLKLMARYKN